MRRFYIPSNYNGKQNPGRHLTYKWDRYIESFGECVYAYSGTDGIADIRWDSDEGTSMCGMNVRIEIANCGLACAE